MLKILAPIDCQSFSSRREYLLPFIACCIPVSKVSGTILFLSFLHIYCVFGNKFFEYLLEEISKAILHKVNYVLDQT